MKTYFTLIIAISLVMQTNCSAQSNSYSSLANKFLAYDFGNDERYNWHFIPKKDRKGILLSELSEKQKDAAFSLLKLYLSDTGFMHAQEIIQLELVLQSLENRQKGDWFRDPGNYAFIFFGEPSDKSAWGWRFEGHHISFNFSTINNKIVSGTPGFLGANPAIVLSGPQKGKQVLKNEMELGFALIQSLTQEQLTKAIISNEVPSDIITFDSRKKNLQFAWAGGQKQEMGKPYYYRIQGPTLIIELDNTQNNANHVHTVVRDLKHDFGGDELLKHYQEYHGAKKTD